MYDESKHWTSGKRKAAGHEGHFRNVDSGTESCFTFQSGNHQAIAELLAKGGSNHTIVCSDATNYHFEVVATASGVESPFPWTLLQFDKVSR